MPWRRPAPAPAEAEQEAEPAEAAQEAPEQEADGDDLLKPWERLLRDEQRDDDGE